MQKRTLLTALALAPLLGACGFRLRGVPTTTFTRDRKSTRLNSSHT